MFRCTKRRSKAGYGPGTKCRMKCRKGFKAHRLGRKKCLADGSWNGEDGECRPLTCPPLDQPLHARVLPQSCLTGTIILYDWSRIPKSL